MSSPHVLAARRRAALLAASLLLDTLVVAHLLSGWAVPAAITAATGLTAVSVLCMRTHRRLTHVTDQRVAVDRAVDPAVDYELAEVNSDPLTGLDSRRVTERFLDDSDGCDLTLALVNVEDTLSQDRILALHAAQVKRALSADPKEVAKAENFLAQRGKAKQS